MPSRIDGDSTSRVVDRLRAAADSTSTNTTRATRNYEIDRTVRHVTNAMGGVQRISVAVVVNEKLAPPPAPVAGASAPAPGAPAAPASQPYTPEELQRMTELVRSVVGFDQARGDQVSVVPARFESELPIPTIAWYLQPDVHLAFKSGLIALGFLAFLVIVIRPIMRALYDAKKDAEAEAEAIASNAPLSVRQIKKSVRFGGQMELRTAFRFEIEAYNHLIGTEDRMEGIAAFNEKRKAIFKGC
jgi:flagellar M-ring protein FliF